MAFKIITPAHVERIEKNMLEFEDTRVPGAGWAFPCDRLGNVEPGSEARAETLAYCLANPDKARPLGVRDYSRDYRNPGERECDRCGGAAYRSSSCGVWVCEACGRHEGLARCFCGWSLSGRNGYDELVEMGEVLDAD